MTDSADRVDLPVACNLGPDDGPARSRRWQQLAETAKPAARRDGPQLMVRYQPGPGVQEELEALAAAEAECCSFVSWSVTRDGVAPVLLVSADPDTPDAVSPIAALFGAA